MLGTQSVTIRNINTIPYDFYQLTKAIDIDLDGNSVFSKIPEYLKKEGLDVMLSYVEFTIASEQKTNLYEAKMIVVGQGEVGKTSLIKKLLEENYNLPNTGNKTTKGIDIFKWKIPVRYQGKGGFYHPDMDEDYEHDEHFFYSELYDYGATLGDVNIWDFGGQEIYYNIHQFFLTEYALYILVWDARKEETLQNFDYWINTIGLLSQNSPVLIVMNKSDIRSRNINERELEKQFSNIKGFFQVSVKSDEGIDNLRKKIIEMIDDLPVVGIEVPKIWLSIKDALKKISYSYIEYEDNTTNQINF